MSHLVHSVQRILTTLNILSTHRSLIHVKKQKTKPNYTVRQIQWAVSSGLNHSRIQGAGFMAEEGYSMQVYM